MIEKRGYVKKEYFKKCMICGKDFKTFYPRVIVCSEKCRKEYKKRDKAIRYQREKNEKIKYRNNRKSIVDIAAKANKIGISYGEYVARYLSTTHDLRLTP